jgi:hypothetical protein
MPALNLGTNLSTIFGRHSITILISADAAVGHSKGANQYITDSRAGEIHAMIKGGKKLLNPLVATQNFEYKMSNILGMAICCIRSGYLIEPIIF